MERWSFPKEKTIYFYTVSNDFKIAINYPIENKDTTSPLRFVSQFELYIYSCLRGRRYVKKVDGKEVVLESSMRDLAKGKTVVYPDTGKECVLLDKIECVTVGALIQFLDDKPEEQAVFLETFCGSNMNKVVSVEDVFHLLPNPRQNIYTVSKRTFDTVLMTSQEAFNTMSNITDTDPRYDGFEEAFPMKMLKHVHDIQPTMIKSMYYTHVILRNLASGGVTYPYIDFIGREKHNFNTK